MRTAARVFLLCFGLLHTLAGTSSPAIGEEKPNFLWLSAEDLGPVLACYGDPHARTPHLDALAAEGIRYARAFSTAGVCAPSRSAIITGMYQNSIGTHHMRGEALLPGWLKPFPIYFREAGYYCTNNAKTDYQFARPTPAEIWDDSSAVAHWRNRGEKQPFFAVFNFTGTHESAIAGDEKFREVTAQLREEQRVDPGAITTLPPYFPDTPRVREEWKRQYELLAALDDWVGARIAELKEAGEWDRTVVMFWTDHGTGLPRQKRWLYDSGTRIPLILRLPPPCRGLAEAAPGSTDPGLVSTVDFAPTMLSLAGLPVPPHFQGTSFLGKERRSYAFGARDRMDERYDLIRTARNHRFRYIRNFEPHKPYGQFINTAEKGGTMCEIRKVAKEGKLEGPAAWATLPSKPAEELYDLESDPHELTNLAGDPAHAGTLGELRSALAGWQSEIGDLGFLPEAELRRREAAAGSAFAILHGSEDRTTLIREMAAAAGRAAGGAKEVPAMLSALGHDEPAVRYWAATGLGHHPAETKDAAGAAAALSEALEDKSPSVAIAAARALCGVGLTSKGLATLERRLADKNPWARLEAAIVLDDLGEVARPVLPAMKSGLKEQPNKYIIRVLNKAVNDLEGTSHEVP